MSASTCNIKKLQVTVAIHSNFKCHSTLSALLTSQTWNQQDPTVQFLPSSQHLHLSSQKHLPPAALSHLVIDFPILSYRILPIPTIPRHCPPTTLKLIPVPVPVPHVDPLIVSHFSPPLTPYFSITLAPSVDARFLSSPPPALTVLLHNTHLFTSLEPTFNLHPPFLVTVSQ